MNTIIEKINQALAGFGQRLIDVLNNRLHNNSSTLV